MAGHTPGKWRVREGKGSWWAIETELMSVNGLRAWYTVARTDFDLTADGYSEGALAPEADAHLIAAAPELLAALSDFVAMGEQYGWDDASTGRDILMRNARAAIAKAKGR